MHNIPSKRRFFTRHTLVVAALLLLTTGVGFGYYRYSQPVGSPTTEEVLRIEQPTGAPDIMWPAAQASIGTVADGVLASKPGQTVRPTASTAKLITVLTVLQKKPLAPGQSGPILTIDQADIDLYNNYVAANGSVVAVRLGEKMSQHQMMQAILVRSSNNLADSLAIWAFGSLSEYRSAAQKYVDSIGMKHTTVGLDASGLSPTTTSTAEDLTRLGIAAMKHGVVRNIVKQTSFSSPTGGTQPNTNWMLGQNGVVGIKTGNIPQVGGVFVIASEFTPRGKKPITIVGAVQGAPTTYEAIVQSSRLAEAIKPLFTETTIVKKGTVVATITTPWGERSDVVTANDITTFGWKYAKIPEPKIELTSNVPFEKDAELGTLSIGELSTQLIATDAISLPTWQWRLTTSR
jgi:D-alanyl-D-alanine carboxypeptidase (penicillin-binding protein 5/6)